MRLAFTVTLAWLVWGITLLTCGLIILLPEAFPPEGHEYKTTVQQRAPDRGERNSEDYLIVSPRAFILATRTLRDGSYQYQTLYADISSTYGSNGELEVKKIHLSNPEKTEQEDDNPGAIAQLKYVSMPGNILNYEVLTKRTQDNLCLYIYELSRLRCFGQ
jgi:hypothetical protein